MPVFPTPEWLDKYVKKINESSEFEEAGRGWGVDWNGDFIFQVDDLPVDKIDDIRDDALRKKLKELVEKYVEGKTVYTFIGLKDGKCTGGRVIKSPDEVEVGFKLIGPYEIWKKVIRGETTTNMAVVTRKMRLEGRVSMVAKYLKFMGIFSDISTEVQTQFVDELVS